MAYSESVINYMIVMFPIELFCLALRPEALVPTIKGSVVGQGFRTRMSLGSEALGFGPDRPKPMIDSRASGGHF